MYKSIHYPTKITDIAIASMRQLDDPPFVKMLHKPKWEVGVTYTVHYWNKRPEGYATHFTYEGQDELDVLKTITTDKLREVVRAKINQTHHRVRRKIKMYAVTGEKL